MSRTELDLSALLTGADPMMGMYTLATSDRSPVTIEARSDSPQLTWDAETGQVVLDGHRHQVGLLILAMGHATFLSGNPANEIWTLVLETTERELPANRTLVASTGTLHRTPMSGRASVRVTLPSLEGQPCVWICSGESGMVGLEVEVAPDNVWRNWPARMVSNDPTKPGVLLALPTETGLPCIFWAFPFDFWKERAGRVRLAPTCRLRFRPEVEERV